MSLEKLGFSPDDERGGKSMIACLNPGTLGVGLSLDELLGVAANAGFAAVEFSVNSLADEVAKSGWPLLSQRMAETGIALASFFLCADIRADDGAFRAGLSELGKLAPVARDAGCRQACTWLEPGIDEDPVPRALTLVRRLRECARVLGDSEINLACEFVGPHGGRGKQHRYIDSIDRALNLIDAIGEPNVGLLLDSIHWYTSGGDTVLLERLPASIIHMVHIDDVPAGPILECEDGLRLLPGEGVIDLHGFMRALEKTGYEGPVSVESMNRNRSRLSTTAEVEEFASKAYRALMRYLR